MSRLSKNFRRALLLGALATVALIGVIVGSHLTVASAGEGRCFDVLDAVPQRKVAMVLGCPKLHKNGTPCLEYQPRVDAAAELFKAGKCEMVLVSSDADAPIMAADLVAAGVPADAILTDPLGVRTRASFVHAKEAFGLNGGIIVSQRYHNERSLYIAEELGGDWVGYDADESTGSAKLRSAYREMLARVKAVIDRHVLDPIPKEKA